MVIVLLRDLIIFFSSMLLGNQCYAELWQIIKLGLIFSYGNATVEGGFLVNKTFLEENLKEHSLFSQRTVDNVIRYHESIHKVPITRTMLTNVRAAHRRYAEHLKESKQNQKKRSE